MMFTVALHPHQDQTGAREKGRFGLFEKEYSLPPVLLFDLGWDVA
jgi:hypothetical protein